MPLLHEFSNRTCKKGRGCMLHLSTFITNLYKIRMKKLMVKFSGNSSDNTRSPLVNRTRPKQKDRKAHILKREEDLFTLQAFAYNPNDDEDDRFDSYSPSKNPSKNFSIRSHRKTHSGIRFY